MHCRLEKFGLGSLFLSVVLGAVLPGTNLKAKEDRFDGIWARAILYDNAGDGGFRRLALSGRAQGDWAIFDPDEGDFDDVLWRRFRFGFKAQLSEKWVAHIEGSFDFNEGLDGSYQGATVSGPCAADVSCKVGMYSSDGNEELSRFDAGWFSLLTATWQRRPVKRDWT